jgi:hypothetical protein
MASPSLNSISPSDIVWVAYRRPRLWSCAYFANAVLVKTVAFAPGVGPRVGHLRPHFSK